MLVATPERSPSNEIKRIFHFRYPIVNISGRNHSNSRPTKKSNNLECTEWLENVPEFLNREGNIWGGVYIPW